MQPTTDIGAPIPLAALRRVHDVVWELPATGDMRVPARVLADETLLEQMLGDRSFIQLRNVATLPGVTGAVLGMPDMHEGYGFPVGGVAGTRLPDGVVSPGGIGFDINCGVRLLATSLTRTGLGERLETLVHELSRSVPSGMGRGSRQLTLDDEQLTRVAQEGVPFLVEAFGFGDASELAFLESGGRLPGARIDAVSMRARERGRPQLGTLGSGNHFLEVQVVDRVEDAAAAARFGLVEGQVTVMLHTGSRGFGHQICTDHVRRMDASMARHGLSVPDRQLACAPLSSKEGQDYFAAMCAAANFGWCNRHVIAWRVRQVFARLFGDPVSLRTVYDVAHNTAKLERHGGEIVCVHRKGATRAFGPSSEELPPAYRDVGQPVLIPGSMGTSSWVLAGNDASMEVTFGSACHGAGRRLSRGAAKRTVSGAQIRRELEAQGIVVRCPSSGELAEEAPLAYKDADRVVDVVHRAGVARKVVRLRPLGVVKG